MMSYLLHIIRNTISPVIGSPEQQRRFVDTLFLPVFEG